MLMKNTNDSSMNVLNVLKKHKIITILVFVVALVGAISVYITYGYYSVTSHGQITNLVLDLTGQQYNIRYYVRDSATNKYIFTPVSPTSAFKAGAITYNSSMSSCTGCTSTSTVQLYGDQILPPHTGNISSADLYFNIVSGKDTNPDVIVNITKEIFSTSCGSSCPTVSTNESLKTLFSKGYGIDYTNSSCTNNATFSVDLHDYSIVVTPAKTNGATTLPETTCNIRFVHDPSALLYILLSNNTISETSATLTSGTIATTNEGLIQRQDDYGISYIFRGNVDNNYVRFAGLDWRILRINGDGSIRIILMDNDMPSSLVEYRHNPPRDLGNLRLTYTTEANSPRASAAGQPNAMMQRLLNWYGAYLITYDKYISHDTLFCNDLQPYSCPERMSSCARTTGNTFYASNGSGTYYFGENLRHPNNLDLKCPNEIDVFSANGYNQYLPEGARLQYPIGTISLKEWVFAGNVVDSEYFYEQPNPATIKNTNNYLYAEREYWTSTPNYGNWGSSNVYMARGYMFTINQGEASEQYVGQDDIYVLPVISLSAGVQISGGNGTQFNPYVIDTE